MSRPTSGDRSMSWKWSWHRLGVMRKGRNFRSSFSIESSSSREVLVEWACEGEWILVVRSKFVFMSRIPGAAFATVMMAFVVLLGPIPWTTLLLVQLQISCALSPSMFPSAPWPVNKLPPWYAMSKFFWKQGFYLCNACKHFYGIFTETAKTLEIGEQPFLVDNVSVCITFSTCICQLHQEDSQLDHIQAIVSVKNNDHNYNTSLFYQINIFFQVYLFIFFIWMQKKSYYFFCIAVDLNVKFLNL